MARTQFLKWCRASMRMRKPAKPTSIGSSAFGAAPTSVVTMNAPISNMMPSDVGRLALLRNEEGATLSNGGA